MFKLVANIEEDSEVKPGDLITCFPYSPSLPITTSLSTLKADPLKTFYVFARFSQLFVLRVKWKPAPLILWRVQRACIDNAHEIIRDGDKIGPRFLTDPNIEDSSFGHANDFIDKPLGWIRIKLGKPNLYIWRLSPLSPKRR